MFPLRFPLALLCASFAAPVFAQELPPGPGKATFERMCTQCHGLEGIVRSKMSKDRWSTIVDDMMSRGAKGTDEEVEQVIDYLAANFSRKLNVNKATASDFTALGLSADEAQAIVRYRVERGPVKDFEELGKVPGVSVSKIAGLKDRLEF